jgi:hypothetical protein
VAKRIKLKLAIPVAVDEHGQWAVNQEIGPRESPQAASRAEHVRSTLANLGDQPSTMIGVVWMEQEVTVDLVSDDRTQARLREEHGHAVQQATKWQARLEALRSELSAQGWAA